jgi:hypothetical protein
MNYALTALLVFCLIAWGFVLVPPAVRLFSGVVRPTDSIGSFRDKMSVLAGATPSRYLQGPSTSAPAPIEAEVQGFGTDHQVLDLTERRHTRPSGADVARRRAAKQRRRQIFTGLLASLPVTFLLAVVVGGPAWLLFTVAMVAFAGYTALLWQMQQRVLEQSDKVAFLPTGTAAPAARADVRHISVVAR